MTSDTAGDRRRLVLGLLASIALVALWGSWPSLTRLGAQQLDWRVIVILRFVVPAIVLVPVTFRIGLLPRGLSWRLLAVMVISTAFGFFVMSSLALRFAPVAEVAPLLPGVPPLCVALWAWLYDKRHFGRGAILGFVLIAVGVFFIAGIPIIRSGHFDIGHALALGAALSWSVYIVAYGRSGLSPIDATAVVSTWSLLLVLPFCLGPLLAAWDAGLGRDLAMQAVMQGFATGLIAIVLFGISVRYLGAPQSAAFAAMTPVVSTSLAIPVLGEWPSSHALVAIVAITAGVILTNWPSGKVPRRT